MVGSSSTTFQGELAGSGGFIKQGTGGLILTGSSSSFSGDSLVEAGQLILQDSGADALGSSSSGPGTVTVQDGATLVFENNSSSFLFYPEIVLGSSVSSPAGAELQLKTGSAEIDSRILINGAAIINNQSVGSELVLSGSSSGGSSGTGQTVVMPKTLGNCLSSNATICQLTLRGPGSSGQSTIKTRRAYEGNSYTGSFTSPEDSNGIKLSNGSLLANLRLEDNIVFQLSGDSDLSGSTIEIDNSELRIFPDIDLGISPHSQVIESTNELLPSGTITFVNDLSNDVNVFSSLSNSVTHRDGAARYNVEGGVTADLLLESVSGDGDIVKKGSGQLKFSGGNQGATTIEEGTLSLGSSSDLFDGTAVTVDSGAIFDVSHSDTVGSISGFGNIQILTGELLSVDVAAGANFIFSGQFSGEGAWLSKVKVHRFFLGIV